VTSDAPFIGRRIVGCHPKGHVSESRGQISAWYASDLRCRGVIGMVSVNCILGRKRWRRCLGANSGRGELTLSSGRNRLSRLGDTRLSP
jgi:hypothetical protein